MKRLLTGLGLTALLAIVALQLGTVGWLSSHGLSALTAAIVLGIFIGNSVYSRIAGSAAPGVTFSQQKLLRAGVILYGLRLTLHDVSQVGIAGVLIDALVLTSTFLLAVTLGTRVFRLDRETAMLIGAGSAICGAAAVMATAPVVRAKADDVTIAVSTVVVFGTLAMFLYPALYALDATPALHGMLSVSARAFGVYTGSTIHEVAQVFAAGRSVSDSAANTAVITKMVRVMMLAPFLLGLAAWIRRGASLGPGREDAWSDSRPDARADARPARIPWFAVAFVGVVIFNSAGWLPPRVLSAATTIDTFLLAMAMAGLGLTTQISTLRAAGPKPLCLGAMLLVWLIAGGGAINALVTAWLPGHA